MQAGSLEWKCKKLRDCRRFQPCCVPTCSYHDRQAPDITYHFFPKRPMHANVRHKWVEFIRVARNEKNWEPEPDVSKICSRHFHPSDFRLNAALRTNLIVTAIPSLNLGFVAENTEKKEQISEHCTKLDDRLDYDGRRSAAENKIVVDPTTEHAKRIKIQDIQMEDKREEYGSTQSVWILRDGDIFPQPVDNFEIVPNTYEYSSDEEEEAIGPDPLEGVGYVPDDDTQNPPNSATDTTPAKINLAEVATTVNTAQNYACRTTCVVPGCKSRYGVTPGISMFRFPKAPETLQKWLDFTRGLVNDENWVHSNSSTVCSLHFQVGTRSLGARSRLLSCAFPTYCVHPNPNPES